MLEDAFLSKGMFLFYFVMEIAKQGKGSNGHRSTITTVKAFKNKEFNVLK